MSKLIRDNNKKINGKYLFGLGIIVGIALVAFVCTMLAGKIRELTSGRNKTDLNIEIETSNTEEPSFPDVSVESSRVSGPETEPKIEESTTESTTEETTEPTTEETTTQTTEAVYEPVEQVIFLQNLEDIQRTIPIINVPDHDFAENRVEIPHISRLHRVYFEELDDVFFSVHINVSDDDTNTYINQGFVLEGINFPPLASENQTYFVHDFTAPTISFEWVLDRLIGHRTIYVETDGILDEHGQLHGYVYFDQDTTTTNGAATEESNFVQLNEWLLAHGFAEPDPNYTGPYADIYAQYPSFNDGLAGYPIIEPINVDLDGNGVCDGLQEENREPHSFSNSIIFYDPELDSTYYGNDNPYSRADYDNQLRENGEAYYDTYENGSRITRREAILQNYPDWSFESWANS